MSYKTILVHADRSPHARVRFELAAQLAITHSAHLVGSAMTGIARYAYQDMPLYMNPDVGADEIVQLDANADAALTLFEEVATSAGVASFESRKIVDEAGSGLCLQARYSDLVIVGQTDPTVRGGSSADLPQYVILHCAKPVLVVPYAKWGASLGKRALVAWDAGMTATRAVTAALPLLQRAEQVNVVSFNPAPGWHGHGEQPGADIGLFLARHGVKVEVQQQVTKLDVGNALMSLAADLGSDLIVMGGYGHSRFREMLLGGATRTVLTSMTAPVLMAH